MTNSTGVVSPSRPSRRRTPSKIRTWSQSAGPVWAGGSGATSASSGTSRASSGRLGPAAAAMRSASTLAHERSERLDERAERETIVADGDRPALQDEPAIVAESRRRLADEPALADAGLPTDEDQGRTAGRGGIGRCEEHTKLLRATDEHRAGQAPSHGRDDRPCSFPLSSERAEDCRVMRRSGRRRVRSGGAAGWSGWTPRRSAPRIALAEGW